MMCKNSMNIDVTRLNILSVSHLDVITHEYHVVYRLDWIRAEVELHDSHSVIK